MRYYSDPRKHSDPHSLPDVEVFDSDYTSADCPHCDATFLSLDCDTGDVKCEDCRGSFTLESSELKHGWFWWYCLPGCMPEGEPRGPFEDKSEAMRNMVEDNCWDDPLPVTICNQDYDSDDPSVDISMSFPGAAYFAKHQHSVLGSLWETLLVDDDEDYAYANGVQDSPDLRELLKEEGYEVVEDSTYTEPEWCAECGAAYSDGGPDEDYCGECRKE